jgi:D-glycero-alpha-D-manno-heptose-7-phosphate kinase
VAVISSYLATRKDLPTVEIRLSWKTQVPMGSGLGGSSTLGVALLRGISQIFGDYAKSGWQWNLLTAIRDTEAAFLETPTGTQDYLAALFGGLSCFHSRMGRIDHATYRASAFEGLSERALVLFSGEQHHSGRSNWEVYKGAIEKDPTVVRGLFELKEIAEKVDNELRAPETDWRKIGALLSEEWKQRKNLFGVSTPKLDALISVLQKLPILGAKVCGAAAGGSLLVLVEAAHRATVLEALERERIQVLKTKPCSRGVTIA